MLASCGRALAGYHYRAIHVPRVRRVARALGALVGRARSLLDVGCGDGTMAKAVAQAVGAERVAGVDVLLRPEVAIDAHLYDGRRLPFADRSFEIVLLADVLHHAADPPALLRECLRVAERAVAVKDHFKLGWLSDRVLLAMDLAGNAASGVRVRGSYLHPTEWPALVRRAGGSIVALDWPLRVHDLPWRLVTRSELQFAALIEPAPRPAARPERGAP